MTSEEQRRAFAEYMGSTASASNGSGHQAQRQAQHQQAGPGPQNPAWYAGLQNAVALQGQGLQNPYAGQQYPAYNPFSQGASAAPAPSSVPPGALATSQQLAQLGASMPPPPRPPGYIDVPRNYQAQVQPQPGPAYNVGWQYHNPIPGSTAMAPANGSRGPPGTVDESRERYHYNYTGAWPPPDVVRPASPPRALHPPPESQVHVLLCHVCSVCNRIRSRGYHRHHPVVPGQPQVPEVCRRCKKKAKKAREKQEKEQAATQTIRIEIDGGEGRGRARSRERVVYVARRRASSSPRRVRLRSSSRARVGVRVLRDERSPSVALRRSRTELRVPSSSPPVDVRFRRHRSDDVYSARERQHAHLPIHRIPELSPSPPPPPPPPRTRSTTRVEYRHESPEPRIEYHRQSPSPVRIGRRAHRSEDAQSRLDAHPAAYRTVHRTYLRESEGSVSTDSRQPSPPPRSILRNPDIDYRTSHRRRMEASHDSMLPEPGGPRVQFVRDPRRSDRQHGGDYTRDHVRRPREYDNVSPPLPPSPPSPALERGFARMRVRPASPSPPPPERDYEDLRISHVSPRRYHELRLRRSSPAPRSRARAPSPTYIRCRSVERRSRSVSPLPDPRTVDWEDVTESESGEEGEGELVSVRRYRDLDEEGRMATFVEERRTRFVRGDGGGRERGERKFPDTPAVTRGYSGV